MTDFKLRELERRWKESGSDNDEAAWLVERVRVGDRLDWGSYSGLAALNLQAASEYLLACVARGELEWRKLELSAYCSHEPARLALGDKAPDIPEKTDDWFVAGLSRFGEECGLGFAAALYRLMVPVWEAQSGREEPRVRRLAMALEDCARCPCEAHRNQIPFQEASLGVIRRTVDHAVEAAIRRQRIRPGALRAGVCDWVLRWAIAQSVSD